MYDRGCNWSMDVVSFFTYPKFNVCFLMCLCSVLSKDLQHPVLALALDSTSGHTFFFFLSSMEGSFFFLLISASERSQFMQIR